MSPGLQSYQGDGDGVRWGNVDIPRHGNRRFTHDLITGEVRIYYHPIYSDHAEGASKYSEDTDPERRALARAIVDRHVAGNP